MFITSTYLYKTSGHNATRLRVSTHRTRLFRPVLPGAPTLGLSDSRLQLSNYQTKAQTVRCMSTRSSASQKIATTKVPSPALGYRITRIVC